MTLESSQQYTRRPSRLGLAAVLIVFAAVVARTLTMPELRLLIGRYLTLEAAFLALYISFTFLPRVRWLLHLYLIGQCALILTIQSIYTDFDFIDALFVMLSFQVPLFFTGRTRWLWIAALVFLTAGLLMVFIDPLRGLALSLTNMAAEIVIAAFITVNETLEDARARSQALISELNDAHKRLELHAGQVEELTRLQERDRVARLLHDSVSQLIFSISLTARSAECLLTKAPARLPQELTRLQEMTAEALDQLRTFVRQLQTPAS